MSGFVTVKLEDAPVEIIDGDRGANYPKQDEFMPEGSCLFLNATNVTKAGFDFSSRQFISHERDELLRKGKLKRFDVVLTTRGTVGNIAFYSEKVPYEHIRINSGMVILRPETPRIDAEFLYSYLRSEAFGDQVKAILSGSAQPQLPIRDLKYLLIPLPPLPEQRKIAAILSTWDEAITLTEQLIAALKRRKQALMQLLLTGQVRFKEFAGEAWEQLTMGEVAIIEMGQSPPGESYNVKGEGIPLLNGPTEFTERFPKALQWTTEPTKLCQPGDILLCVRGSSTGRLNVSNGVYCIGRGLAAIRSLMKDGSTELLEYLLEYYTHDLLSRTAGSTFPNIDKASLSLMRVLLPAPIQQHRIADVLRTCDELIEGGKRRSSYLRQQKRGLMQQLLTGKVRVAVDD